jgi:hypothetical protein
MSVEVLYPLKSKLITRPAVVTNSNYLVWREVLIPASLVELPRQDHEQ